VEITHTQINKSANSSTPTDFTDAYKNLATTLSTHLEKDLELHLDSQQLMFLSQFQLLSLQFQYQYLFLYQFLYPPLLQFHLPLLQLADISNLPLYRPPFQFLLQVLALLDNKDVTPETPSKLASTLPTPTLDGV
jgi:hypothetical protein